MMHSHVHEPIPSAGADQVDPGAFAVSAEHTIALIGLLALPVVIAFLLAAVHLLGPRVRAIASLGRGMSAAPFSTRVAVVLMLATADVHIVLIPGHLAEDPARAALFAFDAVAFIVVSVMAFVSSQWRIPASIVIVATVLTYAVYVQTGREAVDLVGVLTKGVEIAALLAVALPPIDRRSATKTVTLAHSV